MNHFSNLLPGIAFFCLSIPISIIDIKTKRIPDPLNYALLLATLLLQGACNQERLANLLLSSALAFLLFLGIRRATGGLGFGDVKYAASIGALCGFPLAFTAFLCASLTGLAAAFIITVRSGASPRDRRIPFAPFLCLGTLAAVLLERLV